MSESPQTPPTSPFAWQTSCVLGLIACAGTTLLLASRVVRAVAHRIPEELIFDHLGGAVVDHCIRVRQGLPIYCEPSENFFSLLYTPIYYYLSAGMMFLVGDGVAACRITSVTLIVLATAVAMGTAYRLTRARWTPALVFALALAGYARCEFFYDAPRVDPAVTLMLILAVSAAVTVRGIAAPLATGLFLALAFWSKQSSAVFAAIFLLGLLIDDWKRGLLAGAVYALLLAATMSIATKWTGGWFWTFVMELPATHNFPKDLMFKTMRQDWLGPLFVPALALLLITFLLWRNWRRSDTDRAVRLLIVAFVAAATFLTASRTNAGGATNNLVPICLVMSLMLPVGFWHVLNAYQKSNPIWHWRMGFIMLSFVLINGGSFDVARALPDEDSLERWAELKHAVNEYAQQGQVWVVPWGYFTTPMEGQQMRPVMMIVNDYLGGWFGPRTGHSLPDDLIQAITQRKFAAIFYPLKWGHRDIEQPLLENYQERKGKRLFPHVGLKRVEMPIGIFVPRPQ